MFLRNAWYVAAWDGELSDGLLPVRLLGENVVLYRKRDGTAAALEDACPHRKLPLSMGRIKGDDVECGYHGLTFDCSGTCTRVPGADRIPHVARVRSYPVHERYGLLWIWMGEAERADPADIFEVENWGDPAPDGKRWGLNRGESMTLACNYLYMTDNLLDPSHVAWVHRSSFASSACEETPLETTVGENGVTVWRWMIDSEPAPFYAPFLRFEGHADRKQHYEVRYPSNAIVRAVFQPANSRRDGDADDAHEQVFLMDSYNFMTPVDETTTKYYWFQMRNFAPDDEAVSASFAKSVRGAFEEDRVVLEAVQRGIAGKTTPNLNLKIDAGPLRFRWGLAKLIEAEGGDARTKVGDEGAGVGDESAGVGGEGGVAEPVTPYLAAAE